MCRSRNDGEVVSGLGIAIPIVEAKEEELIAQDGATERAAELILPINAALRCEEVSGIERIIAEKFIGSAVVRVRTGLYRNIDRAADRLAELGLVGMGFFLEFFQRIDGWLMENVLKKGSVAYTPSI